MNDQAGAVTYASVLDALPVVAYMARPDGTLSYISPNGSKLTGHAPGTALGVGIQDLVCPEDLPRVLTAWTTAMQNRTPYSDRYRLRFSDGSYHWVMSQASPVLDTHGNVTSWVGVFIDIDDRHSSDIERDRIQRGFRLLAQTGAVALTSLESVAITRLIARACVSNFASMCAIDIVDEFGKWDRASAHRLPEYTQELDALPLPTGTHPIARVLRSNHASVIDVTEHWLDEVEGKSARAALYRKTGVRSIISAPIATPSGNVIGALTCGLDNSHLGQSYIEDDLVFVEEVGRRIGSLVENLRLYERERRIAVELQAASLPAALPRIDHLHLDAEYRPGSAEATIGGDWYDAFILKDGRVAITVGDVLGHGLRAAVTMTKLRQAMQAAAMIHADPNVMLKVADETLKLIDPEQGFATAIALIFDPASASIVFASAGHPGPVIRRIDGTIEDLSSPGIMLGLRSGDETDTCSVETPHGTTFVLFTDGIIEATRDIEEGYERLHGAVADVELLRGDTPARLLVERVLGATPASDDIAVLVATVSSPVNQLVTQTRYGRTPEESPTQPAIGSSRTSSWQFQSSDADSAHAVRHSFIGYAASGSTFTKHVDLATAELVLGELIGNVVRHAPGLVTVDIEWRPDAIKIAVSNEGPVFRLHQTLPDDPLREHGRGLQMIEQCTTSLRVLPTATGGCCVEAVIPHVPE